MQRNLTNPFPSERISTCQKGTVEAGPRPGCAGSCCRQTGCRGALSRLEKGLRRTDVEGALGAAPQGWEAAGSLLRGRLRFSRSVAGGFLKPGE